MNNILEDVEKVAESGISGGSVVAIIAITTVSAIILIFFGSICIAGLRKLFHKFFKSE